MQLITNRAIFSKAQRALESAGFVRLGEQFGKRKSDSGIIYENSNKERVILNFRLAKQISESI